ncbi:protein turtle isoform X1 [Apis mellifera caucasica]|nr:protein turtle isoform X1 [Apis mellifera caucasica]
MEDRKKHFSLPKRSRAGAPPAPERTLEGYYGSGGMGGGGGLQATDLRRRLESTRRSGTTTRRPQSPPRSLRRDASRPCHDATDDQEERVELQATLASGQPTCTGWRACRRQDGRKEDGEEGEGGWRRWWSGGSGVIGSSARGARIFGADQDGRKEGRSGKRHRLRWRRGDLRWIADVATRTLLLGIVLFVTPVCVD